jgi:DNA-binding protein HU-beta
MVTTRRTESAVNKSELVETVAARTGSSPAEARRHVEATLHAITEAVAVGDRVSLLGFGTFEGADRPARTARNPRTGDAVDVPAARVARFRAGAAFRDAVSAGEAPDVPGVVTAPVPARRGRTADDVPGRPSDGGAGGAAGGGPATHPRADQVAGAATAGKGGKTSKKDAKKDAKKRAKKHAKKVERERAKAGDHTAEGHQRSMTKAAKKSKKSKTHDEVATSSKKGTKAVGPGR